MINLYEQDDSTLGLNIASDDVVYIPGYSAKGPVNTPTKVSTLNQFKALFGETPAIFDGEKEKSWIYAAELLNAGMSVLYERLLPTGSSAAKAQLNIGLLNGETVLLDNSRITVKAKYEGLYGNSIQLKVEASGTAGKYNFYIKENATATPKVFTVSLDSSAEDYVVSVLNASGIVTATMVVGNGDVVASINLVADYTSLAGGLNPTKAQILSWLADASNNPFVKLADELAYDCTIITSGGYPNVTDGAGAGCFTAMLTAAATRGDTYCLMDLAENTAKANYLSWATTAAGVDGTVNGAERKTYGQLVGPWYECYCSTVAGNVKMPGSFASLMCAVNAARANNPKWFAVAGTKRGKVSNIVAPEFEVGSVLYETWQGGVQCINPIMNVKPVGYCINGQRTLIKNEDKDYPKALSFMNVRIMLNEIKRVVKKACGEMKFESNDSVFWNTFKSLITPTLEQMKNNRGLEDYKIERVSTNKPATVEGIIRVKPIEAVESFNLTIKITQDSVVIE